MFNNYIVNNYCEYLYGSRYFLSPLHVTYFALHGRDSRVSRATPHILRVSRMNYDWLHFRVGFRLWPGYGQEGSAGADAVTAPQGRGSARKKSFPCASRACKVDTRIISSQLQCLQNYYPKPLLLFVLIVSFFNLIMMNCWSLLI